MKRNGNSKIAVVGWGRGMGHKGHMYLADAVITQANEMKADPYFFVSKTVGKDDPVFPEEKVRIYQKVFPQHAPIFTPQGNLNQALQELSQLGYQGVVVVVGADQKKAFQYLEGNNKEGVPVYQSLGLKKLRVISRQETNSKFANEEGPRATPMREILLNPDASEEDKFKVWRRDMPDELGDREVLDIMNKAESRLVHTNAPKVLSKMSKKAAKLKEAIIRFKENKQLEEARILNPNNKVLVYFRPDTGKTGTPVTNRPISLDMAERLIATYVERHKGEGYRPVFPNNFEIRPAGHSEYTRTEDVEEGLNEFAIDKPDDSDGRSKLIGSIVRLLQAGNRVDFFVPGIRGHISGVGNQGDTLIMKRWKKPYSKVNYSLALDSSDDERFVLKMINPDYYQVVEKTALNEFAPDDGDESRKFIPWNEFVDQLKQILHKDFDCKESINMDVIKAKFVPYDPMEYGPTMIYSYFERRAGRKGANGVRGQIQVGNFFKGSKPGDNQLLTGYHLLKGTEFERYFDLTFDNLYKIARIIQGNTQGRLESQQGLAEGSNPIHPELHNKLTAGGYTHVKDNEYTHPTHGKVKVKPSGTDSYSRTRNGLKPEGVRVHGKGIDSYKSNWTNKNSKFEEGVAEGSLNEFAPGDDGDNGQEDMFFKYAKMWYNGNDAVKQRVEEILAKAGWEIGPLESEEGGAFIVQSGDEDGDTYMGWSAQELQVIDESSTDYLDEK